MGVQWIHGYSPGSSDRRIWLPEGTPREVVLLGPLLRVALHWTGDRSRPCQGQACCPYCRPEANCGPPKEQGYCAALVSVLQPREAKHGWQRRVLSCPGGLIAFILETQGERDSPRGLHCRLSRPGGKRRPVAADLLAWVNVREPAWDIRPDLARAWGLPLAALVEPQHEPEDINNIPFPRLTNEDTNLDREAL